MKCNFLPMHLQETSGEHMSVRILFDTTKTKRKSRARRDIGRGTAMESKLLNVANLP